MIMIVMRNLVLGWNEVIRLLTRVAESFHTNNIETRNTIGILVPSRQVDKPR